MRRRREHEINQRKESVSIYLISTIYINIYIYNKYIYPVLIILYRIVYRCSSSANHITDTWTRVRPLHNPLNNISNRGRHSVVSLSVLILCHIHPNITSHLPVLYLSIIYRILLQLTRFVCPCIWLYM